MNLYSPVRRITSTFFLGSLIFCLTARLNAAEITVSAAASLKDALNEIKALYSAGHPGTTISYNFGGSGALQQQIENGAPADIFLSAAAKQMDALEKKGLLLAGTRRDLLTNKLVLIVSKDSRTVNVITDLTKAEVLHIALGDPKSVPVGSYAREVFTYLNIWESVEPKLVRMLNVRQVLTAVETSNAEAGMVYLTDAKLSNKVRIVTAAPEGSHSPVVYPIAVINGTKHREEALDFAGFLTGTPARQVFIRCGFGILE
ncbi:MAG: modA [Chthoniobacteraceae bacterium]|nr:modA [Chthoniobacteraceae bacterium]